MPDLFLFILILTADRVTKVLIPHFMDLYESIPVIPSFLHLTYVRNTGGAFGILAGWDSPLRRVFFIAASFGALMLLLHLYRHAVRSGSRPVRLSITAIGAGALGNLYDRVFSGGVVDFIDVFAGPYHWPSFNIADSAISVGAVALLYLYLTGHIDDSNGRD
ncbi:signal peptidase II [bacterium]|nr:MAG: signal peptidase II [bacterium]